MEIKINDKKIINSWAMYDWANSVFSLTIATAIFPIYFIEICKSASLEQGMFADGIYYLNIFGFKVIGAELYSFIVSAGFLIIAIISPLLSGIADFKRNKKFFLKMFCYLGSASCIGMYFFNVQNIELGVILFLISLVGFAGSLVFYNAFLPEIVSEDMLDKVSARGYAFGYVGCVILLIINLLTIMKPEFFFPVQEKVNELMKLDFTLNETEALVKAKSYYSIVATKLSFVSVGLWWAGFAQIFFKNVPEGNAIKSYSGNVLVKGFNELQKVFGQLKFQPTLKKYLIGFFFTSMGVQTIMYVASLFGKEELHLPNEILIGTILIIQLIAIVGALAFSRISASIGNIYTLLITIAIWALICVFAYGIQTQNQFMALGAFVGIVMGGIQSLMRSTYAKLIPDGTKDTASYFSFYDVLEKVAIVLGTLIYGILINLTHSMRMSALTLAVFFVLGMIWIAQIKNFKTFTFSIDEMESKKNQ